MGTWDAGRENVGMWERRNFGSGNVGMWDMGTRYRGMQYTG